MKYVFFLVVAFVASVSHHLVAAKPECGGNCPNGGCPQCLCGTTPNVVDTAYWCAQYNWDQTCCKCIADAESKGNANAINYNVDKSYDVGLWQINSRNWAQCNGGKAPCDPQENLNCAIKVYNWGKNKWGGVNGYLWATAKQCGCTKTG